MRHGGADNRLVPRSRPPKVLALYSVTRCCIAVTFIITCVKPVNSFQVCRTRPTLTSRPILNGIYVNSQRGRQFYMTSNDADPNQSAENVIDSTPSVMKLPTTYQLLLFIFTTVLVWTSEPLLSIVDSATVGSFAKSASSDIPDHLSSVVQLAALGPATMLCDSSIFLTYFIGLAATNKLARSSAKNDWKSMIEISSHSLGVSVALSVLVLFVLFLFGKPLLLSIIGPTGALFNDAITNQSIDLTAEVANIALGYTWIRAIAAGFAITGSTAQSLLLCKCILSDS